LAPPIRLRDGTDPRFDAFRNVRDRDLQKRGSFLAEGKSVVNVALGPHSRFPCEAILVSETHQSLFLEGAAAKDIPLYVAANGLLDEIAGFPIHRGILASCTRCEEGFEQVLDQATARASAENRGVRLVVLHALRNHDNLGLIFRAAAAFDVDAVLLCEETCDPLYRKACRVSVGAVLVVPFARAAITTLLEALRDRQIAAFAMTLEGAEPVEQLRSLSPRQGVAIVLGSEGPGLPAHVSTGMPAIKIAMTARIDSLNVGVAASIAMHHMFAPRQTNADCF
jgi:tRNA G18 (ribose-2'-O)-methylase SpoU